MTTPAKVEPTAMTAKEFWMENPRPPIGEKWGHFEFAEAYANYKRETGTRELLEALKALIVKLKAMEEPINSCIVMAQIHGAPYVGPNWSEEMAAAETAISRAEAS